MARLLSFYYSRRKTASLGPSLSSRQQIIDVVLRRQAVRDAILEEQKASIGKPELVKKQARKNG